MTKLVWIILSLLAAAAVAQDYKISHNSYAPNADHTKVCQASFGESATVADFAEFQAMDTNQVQDTMAAMGIGVSRFERIYFVTYNGNQVSTASDKAAYYFENHGTNGAPAYFDPIATHGGLSLAADNLFGQVVCNVGGETQTRKLVTEHQQDELDGIEVNADPEAEPEAPAGAKANLARRLRNTINWGW